MEFVRWSKCFLIFYHVQRKYQKDETVPGIAEHHRKHERERDDCVGDWIVLYRPPKLKLKSDAAPGK